MTDELRNEFNLKFTADEAVRIQEAWELFQDKGAHDKDEPTERLAFETPEEMLAHMVADVVDVYTSQFRR